MTPPDPVPARYDLSCEVDLYRDGWTLHRFLVHRFRYHPPAVWDERIAGGAVRVNGHPAGAGTVLAAGDRVEYTIVHAEPAVDFEFEVLETPHFDIHYYPEAGVVIEDVSRMAERWYERFARLFQHEFDRTKPLVLYADHPDVVREIEALAQRCREDIGDSALGIEGANRRPCGRVENPDTLTHYDPDHPYIVALYDITDGG